MRRGSLSGDLNRPGFQSGGHLVGHPRRAPDIPGHAPAAPPCRGHADALAVELGWTVSALWTLRFSAQVRRTSPLREALVPERLGRRWPPLGHPGGGRGDLAPRGRRAPCISAPATAAIVDFIDQHRLRFGVFHGFGCMLRSPQPAVVADEHPSLSNGRKRHDGLALHPGRPPFRPRLVNIVAFDGVPGADVSDRFWRRRSGKKAPAAKSRTNSK